MKKMCNFMQGQSSSSDKETCRTIRSYDFLSEEEKEKKRKKNCDTHD